MSLRIQLECYHEFRCDCKPIKGTQVSRDDVTYNLVKSNPALAKYLYNSIVLVQTLVDKKQIKVNQDKSSYKSIVEQKNLNILLSHQYPLPKPNLIINQQQLLYKQQKPKSPSEQLKINNFISTEVQTSPFLQKPTSKPKQLNPPQSPRQKQIKQHYKQLKHTSRYLSDSGFRKYFKRQVFQNYGRQNTHGTNDGIIYGNYMKTHNINPHTGYNRPQDQQTFYHALIVASPQKIFASNLNCRVEQNRNKNMSQSRFKEKDENLQKPLKKHDNDREQIIGDNVRYHEKLNELSKSKTGNQQRSAPISQYYEILQARADNWKQWEQLIVNLSHIKEDQPEKGP